MKTRKRAKAGSGQLLWSGKGWSARYWAVVDGERIRRCVSLGTDNRAVATAKLARLVDGEADAASVAAPETFEQAARRIVSAQGDEGLKTWTERLSRFERFAFPEIGALQVTKIRPSHVRATLEATARQGLSRRTCTHLKVDISGVLGELWRAEVVTENVALRVTVPKGAAVDARERVILTDEEFERFMSCPDVDPGLHVMALASRTFGGMRTSDLHAWDWSHVDTSSWVDAHVPRPKTKTRDRLTLPAVLVAVLQAWWHRQGAPASGPVFPVRRGPRAGQRKSLKNSYAAALRDALWQAGIVRPLPGWDEALAAETRATSPEERAALEEQRRRLCLIQAGSDEQRPLDFHSFRRAYNTALADAGVNVQTAMRLAGHRNASTHMRYVLLAERLEAPEKALPRLGAMGLPSLRQRISQPLVSVARPGRFERPTFGSVDRRSIQLSYGRVGGPSITTRRLCTSDLVDSFRLLKRIGRQGGTRGSPSGSASLGRGAKFLEEHESGTSCGHLPPGGAERPTWLQQVDSVPLKRPARPSLGRWDRWPDHGMQSLRTGSGTLTAMPWARVAQNREVRRNEGIPPENPKTPPVGTLRAIEAVTTLA